MPAGGRKRAGKGGWLLFWLAFIMGITLLFLLNLERIKGTLNETRLLERLFKNGDNESQEDGATELERRIQDLANAASEADGQQNTAELPVVKTLQDGTALQTGQVSQAGSALQTGPASQAGPVPLDEAAVGIAARKEQIETRNNQDKTVSRSVYLMKVDSSGTILWTSVRRDLPASDSPLLDAMEALIKGPLASEEKQGLISLIPKNVKIQNAVVQGNTAYISFSEDFLFNTYGVEGYAGQRKQIVLTATEFSNVKDVQILIDGKRVDYLGEGIWIGSPVSRNML